MPTERKATRVAAIYDIHGNLPALEAVLDEIERAEVDLVVVGGDVVWGPWPRQTVERLQELTGAAFVRGNADREVAERMDESAGLDKVVADINRWCFDQLGEQQRAWLRTFEDNVVVDIEGVGPTLFCHGSPRSDEEMLTAGSPRERLDAALGSVQESTVVCGHTHMQFDRSVDGKRLVNAGSVGLPYEEKPGAFWAHLGPDVALGWTSYDVEGTLAEMERSGCPHVEMVFIDTLRNPPSRDEVIRQFEATAAQQTYY